MNFSETTISQYFEQNPIKPIILNQIKERAVKTVFSLNNVGATDIYNFFKYEDQGTSDFDTKYLEEFEDQLLANEDHAELDRCEQISKVIGIFEDELNFVKRALLTQAGEPPIV